MLASGSLVRHVSGLYETDYNESLFFTSSLPAVRQRGSLGPTSAQYYKSLLTLCTTNTFLTHSPRVLLIHASTGAGVSLAQGIRSHKAS